MIRWGLFIVILGLLALAAGWLADNAGTVNLVWQDYQIETSVAVVVAIAIVLIIVLVLLFRFWWTLRRVPGALKRGRNERRRRRGYEALSRGLVAVAAGDGEVARRQSRRAEALVDDSPLTMLLSAQAAQLEGDEKAAERFFSSMREQHETEFLGVRGLLTQAIKREDWPAALKLARRAYNIQPRSEWVVATLLDLQRRTGEWHDAELTLSQAVKLNLIAADDAPRRRAELQLAQSLASEGHEAFEWARKSFKSDATFAAGVARYAKLLIKAGKHRKAASVIEEAWSRNPAPELAEVYWQAKQCDDALKKVQAAQRLSHTNPRHLESRIAVAVAALEARLWGEARSALEPAAGDDAPPRVCRLMAELEEAEHGDLARARTWLMRATADEYGPQMSSNVPQMSAPAE